MPVDWIYPAVFAAFVALIGVIWRSGERHDEKQDATIEAHIREDMHAHERVQALETEVANLKSRLKDVGDRLHGAREDFRVANAEMYKFIVERLK